MDQSKIKPPNGEAGNPAGSNRKATSPVISGRRVVTRGISRVILHKRSVKRTSPVTSGLEEISPLNNAPAVVRKELQELSILKNAGPADLIAHREINQNVTGLTHRKNKVDIIDAKVLTTRPACKELRSKSG